MEDIVYFMQTQFDPKRFIVQEQFKFWSDVQRKPAWRDSSGARSKVMPTGVTCDFASIEDSQDEALRTKFICSVRNVAILKALFKMDDDELIFRKAVEVAAETEDAAKWPRRPYIVPSLRPSST